MNIKSPILLRLICGPLIFSLFFLAGSPSLYARDITVKFYRPAITIIPVNGNNSSDDNVDIPEGYVELQILLSFIVTGDEAFPVRDETPESMLFYRELYKFIDDINMYQFEIMDWAGNENFVDTSSEHITFIKDRITKRDMGYPYDTDDKLRLYFESGVFEDIVTRMPVDRDDEGTVFIRGYGPERLVLRLNVTNLPIGWNLEYMSDPPDGWAMENRPPLTTFRNDFEFGLDEGNLSLDFSASWAILPDLEKDETPFGDDITTISIAGKIPLTTPDDVGSQVTAQNESSEEVHDLIELSVNRVGYGQGGSLNRFGLHARTNPDFNNSEITIYYQPVMGWFQEMHGFYALEMEGGYRTGDAEWLNLVTMAPDRGNGVGRLGMLVEWAPEIDGINRNLAEGLRFYVRGRGWLDVFEGGDGSTDIRFRPFFDSELFYNFSDDWRIFLRGELGYLPPDLSLERSRVYVGVGCAF
jgi:hypothetical protein